MGVLTQSMYRFQFDFTPLDLVALDQNFISLASAVDYLQQQPTAGVVFQAPFTVLDGTGSPAIDIPASGGGAIGPPGSQIVWDSAGNWQFTGNARMELESLKNLADVSLSANLMVGDFLMWTGINWTNAHVGTGGLAGQGITAIAPFNVITTDNKQPLVIDAAGNVKLGQLGDTVGLGNGLFMDTQGHTWIYNGLTTYPLGGNSADPSAASLSLHGNADSTASWLAAQLDSAGAETYIGGIGGGHSLNTPNPGTLQILGLNGIALGTSQGGTPCMTIQPDCSVQFSGALSAPSLYMNSPPNAAAAGEAVTAAWVREVVNPPGGASASVNGFVTLAAGIILQWGYVEVSGATPYEYNVTFPKAFPTASFFGIGVTKGLGIRNNASGLVSNLTRTGMTVLFDAFDGQNNVLNGGYWMAIGH